MKKVVELSLLISVYLTVIKILLLCWVDIQESSRRDNAKFNVLRVIWESKKFWKVHFQAFRDPKIQNDSNHGTPPGYAPLGLLQTSHSELLGW